MHYYSNGWTASLTSPLLHVKKTGLECDAISKWTLVNANVSEMLICALIPLFSVLCIYCGVQILKKNLGSWYRFA